METTLEQKRKKNFNLILLIIILEIIGFGVWAYTLSLRSNDPGQKSNFFFGLLLLIAALDFLWLFITDRLLFNKECVMRRINFKKSICREKKVKLEEVLQKISDEKGKPITTSEAQQIWQFLRKDCTENFKELKKRLIHDLEQASNSIIQLDEEQRFLEIVKEENICQYCKTAFGL